MKLNFLQHSSLRLLETSLCQHRGLRNESAEMIGCQDCHIAQRRRACVLVGRGKSVQLILKCLQKQMMGKRKTQLERGVILYEKTVSTSLAATK